MQKTCKKCNKQFKGRARRLYCSRICCYSRNYVSSKGAVKTLSCANCYISFTRPIWRNAKNKNFFCKAACYRKFHRGKNHGSWRGGRFSTTDKGYVILNLGNGKRRPEHIHIVEQRLGRSLLPGEVVHHINFLKTDNRPGNLMVMSKSWHQWLHMRIGSKLMEMIREGKISPSAL